MGRPKIYKHGREEIGCYLNIDEYEAFEDIRWRERKGKTEIAREAILEYIKNHSEGNITFKLDKWNEDENFKAVPTLSSRSEIWYNHLKDCNPKELTDIMIYTTRINQQCKALKGIK